jgi:hypothetical protein
MSNKVNVAEICNQDTSCLVIEGLAGSGKLTVALEAAKRIKDSVVLADEKSKVVILATPPGSGAETTVRSLLGGTNAIIFSPSLTLSSYRDKAAAIPVQMDRVPTK